MSTRAEMALYRQCSKFPLSKAARGSHGCQPDVGRPSTEGWRTKASRPARKTSARQKDQHVTTNFTHTTTGFPGRGAKALSCLPAVTCGLADGRYVVRHCWPIDQFDADRIEEMKYVSSPVG